MRTEELDSVPGLNALLLKAVLTAPTRRGGDLPDTEVALNQVTADRERLAGYDRVCGFRLSDTLPPTYPHIMGFPLAMRLLTDPGFPFPLPGLVHAGNRITQHRPIGAADPLDLRVRADSLETTGRGRQFVVRTRAYADDTLVWEEESRYLRRERDARTSGAGTTAGDAATGQDGAATRSGDAKDTDLETPGAPRPDTVPTALWRLPKDLGRRYAAVSGDHNPIHLYPVTARLGGFKRPIAHGMWTLARCLSAMEGRLPDAFTVEVAFRRPVSLPGTVGFLATPSARGYRIGVHDRSGGKTYLTGRIDPA